MCSTHTSVVLRNRAEGEMVNLFILTTQKVCAFRTLFFAEKNGEFSLQPLTVIPYFILIVLLGLCLGLPGT